MKLTRKQAFDLGMERLENVDNMSRVFVYRAPETDLDYVLTRDEIVDLGRRLGACEPDAYSLWCAETGEELQALGGYSVGDTMVATEQDDPECGPYEGKVVNVRRDLDNDKRVDVFVSWEVGERCWMSLERR